MRSVISENKVLENTSNRGIQVGGGIHYGGLQDLTITDSEIVSNFSPGNGGGISAASQNIKIVDSNVTGNLAGSQAKAEDAADGNGGGIYVFDANSFSILGGSVSGNKALNRGGGIFTPSFKFNDFFVGPNASGQSTEFVGNQALRFDGGGIFFLKNTTAVLRDAIFEDNKSRSGAAIATDLESSTIAVTLNNVTNINNVSRRDDGGYSIGEEVIFSETSATLDELDLAIAELDDLTAIA